MNQAHIFLSNSFNAISVAFQHYPPVYSLDLPNGSLYFGFTNQNSRNNFSSPLMRVTRPAYLILLHPNTRNPSRSTNLSLCKFLHPPVTPLHILGPNIPINTPYSKTLIVSSVLYMENQVSHPHTKHTKDQRLSYYYIQYLQQNNSLAAHFLSSAFSLISRTNTYITNMHARTHVFLR